MDSIRTPQGVRQFRRDLVVSSIQPEDAGIYQCFASNEVGVISAASELKFIQLGTIGNISDEAPRNLRAEVDTTTRTVRLLWEAPPGIPREKLAVFIVHFYETNGECLIVAYSILMDSSSCRKKQSREHASRRSGSLRRVGTLSGILLHECGVGTQQQLHLPDFS